MYGIFAGAKIVLACVGPHANESERLSEYFGELDRVFHHHKICFECVDAKYEGLERNLKNWLHLRGADYVDEALGVIDPFKNRPYWARL